MQIRPFLQHFHEFYTTRRSILFQHAVRMALCVYIHEEAITLQVFHICLLHLAAVTYVGLSQTFAERANLPFNEFQSWLTMESIPVSKQLKSKLLASAKKTGKKAVAAAERVNQYVGERLQFRKDQLQTALHLPIEGDRNDICRDCTWLRALFVSVLPRDVAAPNLCFLTILRDNGEMVRTLWMDLSSLCLYLASGNLEFYESTLMDERPGMLVEN